MDRLPWTSFHWRVITGLGVSWILDGLEIQIVSTVGSVLTDKGTLHLTAGDVGLLGSVYLLGEVIGALVFGRITDNIGRKKMFITCLLIYLVASGLGGFSFNLWSLLLCRFVAGTGIGGEYTAINSAIDELIPSHYRGRVDIAVNGTYWAGAMIGAAASIFLLNPAIFGINVGWRIGFLIGPFLGLFVIYLRRALPESPRWLMTHGREQEAEETVDGIEAWVERDGVHLEPVPDSKALEVSARGSISYIEIAKTMLRDYPGRSFLGFSMMVTQAFLYNAIFFTLGLVLGKVYKVPSDQIGFYIFPFALGNLLGPLILGPLFDTVGRRKMILGTYGGSGVLLAIDALFFHAGLLNPITQTIFWCLIFFFASAGASSAYLTVSEIFPLELRAQAISFFFAASQGAGGVAAPFIFGALVGLATANGGLNRLPLTIGYLFGAAVMIAGGLIAWFFGVNAERQSLEDIASPLSAVNRPSPGPAAV
ncbi:MAG: MFS transporter [Candidatus Dormibacteraeota bacterium]|uniref:MFS transporter n=1 Tax=Candidatus Dormiibacter inghamiae TaxID=3127013 RepID=A0A934KDF5_9BACT|nr:MFS transporter [Candidatus Dormibacteraeota bacterium]MBJ7606108.1 MFS transporter [Candidatus Dormibacteraeota bacterium]